LFKGKDGCRNGLKTRCLILTVLLLGWAASASALTVRTGKDRYVRYELVDITASLGQSETAAAFPEVLHATIWRGRQKVISVGELQRVPLRRNGESEWRGYWPIPFNPALGAYRLRLNTLDPEGRTLTAVADFSLAGQPPYTLPAGFSVVTDEGGKNGPYATPGLQAGEPAGLRNLIRWADYMGADAFWQCVGQTQVWGELKPENFPWAAGSLNMAKKVGAWAHAAGMKYGAWITAFVVIGQNIEASGYRFTTGYDKKTGRLRPLHYISLGDEKRLADLAGLMKEFAAAPEIDYLGLDYMRTDFGGYEFATEFVRDMSIPAPPEWDAWSGEQRSLWMAKLIEEERNPAARDRWEWWRAHKVALVITRLLAEVKAEKPIWIFSLGWVTGHQHGQDVAMMRDAGIQFNSPMFYSIPKDSYQNMLTDWQDYLRRTPASLVIGECVDWNLLGRTLDPSGPQEHLDRQLQALAQLGPKAHSFGFFWHDLARSHFGARGPYGTLEWVLAGTSTFTQLKAAAGRISLRADLRTPAEMVLNQNAEIQVTVSNATSNTLTAVRVELLPLPRLTLAQAEQTLPELGPHASRSVALACRTDQIYAPNGGKQMIAIRAACAQDAARDAYWAFRYLTVVAAPSGTTPVATQAPTPLTVRLPAARLKKIAATPRTGQRKAAASAVRVKTKKVSRAQNGPRPN
jgi:hypothetical protein